MGLIPGAINFPKNFNITASAPIDARMRVEFEADLTSDSTWATLPVFKGMIVAVMETGDIWVLVNETETTNPNSWKKIASLVAGEGIVISGNTVSIDKSAVIGDIINDNNSSSASTYSSEKILSLVGTAFKILVVDELPSSGDADTIYFVPSQGETGNTYDEYMYVGENWEKIGSTSVDLSNYYTKDEINGMVEPINGSISSIQSSVADLSGEVVQHATSITNINTEISNLSDDITGKQDKLTAGNGIEISGATINANTSASTVSDIKVSAGSPISALGIWPDNTIPAGTSVQDILLKLLSKEIFPSAATKPALTIKGAQAFGFQEIGASVTITGTTTTQFAGKFNASFTSPAQPSPTGVTWSGVAVTTSQTGFTGDGNTKTVVLGENKIKYTWTGDYTEPSNMPVTNLGNQTRSTTEVTTATTEYSAIWSGGTASAVTYTTATGVYPLYINVSGATITQNAVNYFDEKNVYQYTYLEINLSGGTIIDDLSKATKIIIEEHSASGKVPDYKRIAIMHIPNAQGTTSGFTVGFPSVIEIGDVTARTCDIMTYDVGNKWVPFVGTTTTIEKENYYKNKAYTFIGTGNDAGPDTQYQFVFNVGLNQ